MGTRNKARLQRKIRIRKKIEGTAERPRLTVYRSLNHIYAQVVDDVSGRTLVSASSLSKEVRDQAGEGGKTDLAKKVGELLGQRCKEAQVETVVFDRNGLIYHGRVAAVADGAREAGLRF